MYEALQEKLMSYEDMMAEMNEAICALQEEIVHLKSGTQPDKSRWININNVANNDTQLISMYNIHIILQESWKRMSKKKLEQDNNIVQPL